MADKRAAAHQLAHAHYESEDGLVRIYLLVCKGEDETDSHNPIKLLEVNEFTIPSGIMPLQFDPVPSRGIPYPSVIVEVTPEEFDKIQSTELKLPNGWEIAEEIPKNVTTGLPH